MDENSKVIQMHFPLEAVVGYVQHWKEQVNADPEMSDAEKAMCEDIVTLVNVAASSMQKLPLNFNPKDNAKS